MQLSNTLLSRQPPDFMTTLITTIIINGNKYELAPDRFNEGLFVFQLLLENWALSKSTLEKKLFAKTQRSNDDHDDFKEIKAVTHRTVFAERLILQKHTLLVRVHDFVMKNIIDLESIRTNFSDAKRLIDNPTYTRLTEVQKGTYLFKGKNKYHINGDEYSRKTIVF